FSSFRGRHGLYLEDLFVRPAFRRRGIGSALFRHLARRCSDEGWTRFEWAVLDWNAPSIAFYKSLGADLMQEWTICRLTGDALARLGAREDAVWTSSWSPPWPRTASSAAPADCLGGSSRAC